MKIGKYDFLDLYFFIRFGLRAKIGLVISFPVYSDVFCLHLNEDLVAFGCKGNN